MNLLGHVPFDTDTCPYILQLQLAILILISLPFIYVTFIIEY